MKKLNQKGIGHVALILIIVGVISAGGFALYNSQRSDNDSSSVGSTSQQQEQAISAVDLRVALNNALREHVEIAGVALRNIYVGDADAEAAVNALDENSKEVAGLVGAAYGEQAEESFLSLWRSHIGFFADYTTAAKTGDKAAMDKALEDLAGYGKDASAFFEAANPNLPASAVKPLLEMHRDHVIDTVNLIGAGKFDEAYISLGEAADQVGTIADALAGGIAKQMPEKFAGNPESPAADLRVSLNNALREHVNIAGVTLRNVFLGAPDTSAAVAALDVNSKEVAAIVGAAYGEQAEESFLSLWRAHIGFFADYTTAAKAGDKDAMNKALADLDGYTEDASTFFSSANPNLPKDTVKEVLGHHKEHVIDTVNAIGGGDYEKAYLLLGDAADQAGTIADAIAGGVSAQFPDKFSN